MAFDSSQLTIVATIIRVGQQRGAPAKHIRAALATGYVESRFRNLINPVDHDSRGVFQQRPSQGWGTVSQVINVEYAANKFYEVAAQKDRANYDPGTLAAKVQRPAKQYEGRYAAALSITDKLLGITSSAISAATSGAGALLAAATNTATTPATWGVGGLLLAALGLLFVKELID